MSRTLPTPRRGLVIVALALMAVGLLVGRLGADEAAARAEFGERFAAFAGKETRTRVKDAFG